MAEEQYSESPQTQQENWKPMPGYEGIYEVSDLGEIKSLARMRKSKNGCLCPVKEKLLTKVPLRNGRLIVLLCNNIKKTNAYVHRLVLEAFVGPCPDGMECCHNDGDRTNNRLENLRWDTHKNNMALSYALEASRDGDMATLMSMNKSVPAAIIFLNNTMGSAWTSFSPSQ